MTPRQRLIAALVTAILGGAGAGVVQLLSTQHEEALLELCAEDPSTCEHVRALGVENVPVRSCLLTAEPGFLCRDGLKYGPGMGGSESCTCAPTDKTHPHTVMAGEDPLSISGMVDTALDPSTPEDTKDEIRNEALKRLEAASKGLEAAKEARENVP